MKSNTKPWQKLIYYLGIFSFIMSVVCLIYLYLTIDDMGLKNPVSSSLAAVSFFCASVGVVLINIGKCDIPSFKINKTDT